MKALSNEKIVETVRWKEGEWAIHINHKDNGVQSEGEEGKRYEADFTDGNQEIKGEKTPLYWSVR